MITLPESSQEEPRKEPTRKLSKRDTGPKPDAPARHILGTKGPGSSEEHSEGEDSFPDMWGPPPAATARDSVPQRPPSTGFPAEQRKLSKHDSRTEANFMIDEQFAGLADPEVDVANWPLFTEVSGARFVHIHMFLSSCLLQNWITCLYYMCVHTRHWMQAILLPCT